MTSLPPPRFPSPPSLPIPIEHVAHQAMTAFEREFWADHDHRSQLVSAPLRVAVNLLFPLTEPPEPPSPSADPADSERYGELLSAWAHLQHTRSRFEQLISYLSKTLNDTC